MVFLPPGEKGRVSRGGATDGATVGDGGAGTGLAGGTLGGGGIWGCFSTGDMEGSALSGFGVDDSRAGGDLFPGAD